MVARFRVLTIGKLGRNTIKINWELLLDSYFDINYNKVYYIPNTGRGWNSAIISVSDKVYTWFNNRINNTAHFIELVKQNKLLDKIVINFYLARWFDAGYCS